MSLLEALVKVLPPPEKPSETPDRSSWQPVEAQLQIVLPEDYKEFINLYGTGAIDDFLWILNPFSKNRHLSFVEKGMATLDELRQLLYEPVPYAIYPDADGIVPWGITDNGDVLYWLCKGIPSSWLIVVNEGRGPRWREFQLSTTNFLTELITGNLIVDVFPDDFPSECPEFTSA